MWSSDSGRSERCFGKLVCAAGEFETGNPLFVVHSTNTSPALISLAEYFAAPVASLTARHCQRTDPMYHAPKEPFCETALGQHQPVVPGMLDQAAAGLHQPFAASGSATSSRSSSAAPAATGFPSRKRSGSAMAALHSSGTDAQPSGVPSWGWWPRGNGICLEL